MPTPDFILALREKVGHAELWLPGATAVVRREGEAGTEVLLVRRADTGEWTPVAGIVEPGEEPATAARREAWEEARVDIRVDRLVSVSAGDPHTFPNGDRVVFLDHAFACTWVAGAACVGDDESVEVGWFRVDALPPMAARFLERVGAALSDELATRFVS